MDELKRLASVLQIPLTDAARHFGDEPIFEKQHVRIVGYVGEDGGISPAESAGLQTSGLPVMPPDAVAYQARTAGSPLSAIDGWLFFALDGEGAVEGRSVPVERLSVVKLADGPTVPAKLRYGYLEGSYVVAQVWPAQTIPDAKIEWASPVLWIKPR